ncbi:acyltransferase [Bradyrhizobium sp. 33ap4]|uniref:acyltransferase family protein n=1 Tax=Bradyrhizobium sp. 33ap4 TaxID=3061630 RepID=UPI002931C246|nr:acyltransferase [Bradyrhizobium sp. 33ap4]
MNGKNSSDLHWLAPLDGLRAVAAITVLADHTHLLPAYAGSIAVMLFFTLSAFLLTRPFVDSNSTAYSWRGAASYFIRRAFRIYPMLIVFVCSLALLSGGGKAVVYRNLIHFKGDGHLWSVTQELLFYVLLPVIALLLRAPRLHSAIVIAVLIIGAALVDKFLTTDLVSLPANGSFQPFYLSPFLIGMASAFAAPRAKALAETHLFGRRLSNAIAIGVAVFVGESVYMYPLGGSTSHLSLSFGVLLLLLWTQPTNFLSRALSIRSLRLIGVAGFSFYLWHWIPVTLWVSPWIPPADAPLSWLHVFAFGFSLICTVVLSSITLRLVEKPGIALGAYIAEWLNAASIPAALRPNYPSEKRADSGACPSPLQNDRPRGWPSAR